MTNLLFCAIQRRINNKRISETINVSIGISMANFLTNFSVCFSSDVNL